MLRVLRDNSALTRQAYVEFDLEAMFGGEVYADFVAALARLPPVARRGRHAPRTAGSSGGRKTAQKREPGRSTRSARRGGRDQLSRRRLPRPPREHDTARDSSRRRRSTPRLLPRSSCGSSTGCSSCSSPRTATLLLDPHADRVARERYTATTPPDRLRRSPSAAEAAATHDRYGQLKLVMARSTSDGCPALGLPALGSYLWSARCVGSARRRELANDDLLAAVRALATVETRRPPRRRLPQPRRRGARVRLRVAARAASHAQGDRHVRARDGRRLRAQDDRQLLHAHAR